MSPEKGVDRAIGIARETGVPLKIAGKIYPEERNYFESTIAPLLRAAEPLVEFVGEVGQREKNEFLGKAKALLLPIDWPEPFGLVMIEALACGTPVIAAPVVNPEDRRINRLAGLRSAEAGVRISFSASSLRKGWLLRACRMIPVLVS